MKVSVVSQVSGEVIEIFDNATSLFFEDGHVLRVYNAGAGNIAQFFTSPHYPIYWREWRQGDEVQPTASNKLKILSDFAKYADFPPQPGPIVGVGRRSGPGTVGEASIPGVSTD